MKRLASVLMIALVLPLAGCIDFDDDEGRFYPSNIQPYSSGVCVDGFAFYDESVSRYDNALVRLEEWDPIVSND